MRNPRERSGKLSRSITSGCEGIPPPGAFSSLGSQIGARSNENGEVPWTTSFCCSASPPITTRPWSRPRGLPGEIKLERTAGRPACGPLGSSNRPTWRWLQVSAFATRLPLSISWRGLAAPARGWANRARSPDRSHRRQPPVDSKRENALDDEGHWPLLTCG